MMSMLKMLPGVGAKLGDLDIDDKEFSKLEAMIHSMTLDERRDPDILDASRRRRISAGSGTGVTDVAGLVKTFKRSREMMKMMAGSGGAGAMNAMQGMMGGGGDMFGGMGGRKVKQRSKRKRQPRKKKGRR